MKMEIRNKRRIGIFFYVRNDDNLFKLGGAERRLTRIFDGLTKFNFETHVVLMTNTTSQEIIDEYMKYANNKSVKICLFDSYTSLLKYMILKRFDWISFTDSYRKMLPFFIFGMILGSKRLMLNVTTYLSELKFNNPFQKILFLFVLNFSNNIDVLYPSGYKVISSSFQRKNVSLTPGVFTDTDLFKPSEKDQKIVFLSSLIDIKNPVLFLESIIRIKDFLLNHKYQVNICGSGPLYAKLTEIISKNEIEDLVSLKGNIPSYEELRDAAIFVTLQNYNNYPSQALLEAISSGCYIVASNEGDTKLIVNDSFGKLCELSEVSVSEAIKEYVLKNKIEKKEILINAREFAIKNFNIENSLVHYKNIFEN